MNNCGPKSSAVKKKKSSSGMPDSESVQLQWEKVYYKQQVIILQYLAVAFQH